MRDGPWLILALVAAALGTAGAMAPHRDRRLTAVGRGSRGSAGRLRRLLAWGRSRLDIGPAARRRRSASRASVMRALAGLAAELEAGQLPGPALIRAGGPQPPWRHAISAVRAADDVAGALERDAKATPVLLQLAACWRVAERTGSGLAASVSRLAVSARAAEDIRAALDGQLAVPRATARMLALLPLIGVGFGVMLGADPVGWLTGTGAGRACLVGGVALSLVGLWWTGRIATAVERRL